MASSKEFASTARRNPLRFFRLMSEIMQSAHEGVEVQCEIDDRSFARWADYSAHPGEL